MTIRMVLCSVLVAAACGSELAEPSGRDAGEGDSAAGRLVVPDLVAPLPSAGDRLRRAASAFHDRALQPRGPDRDGDGFSSALDCDDGDPRAFPGNPEQCDGVDNDCDGVVEAPFGVSRPPELVLRLEGATAARAAASPAGGLGLLACARGHLVGRVGDGVGGDLAHFELRPEGRGCTEAAVAWVGGALAPLWVQDDGLGGALLTEAGGVVLPPRSITATKARHLAAAAGPRDRLIVAWADEVGVRAALLDAGLDLVSGPHLVLEGTAGAVDAAGIGRGFLVVAAVQEGSTWRVRGRALDGEGAPGFEQVLTRSELPVVSATVAATEVGYVAAWAVADGVVAAALSWRGTLQGPPADVARALDGRQVVEVRATAASGRGLTDGVGLLWSEAWANGLGLVFAARLDEEARSFEDRVEVGRAVRRSLDAAPSPSGLVLCGLEPDGSRGGSLWLAALETCF